MAHLPLPPPHAATIVCGGICTHQHDPSSPPCAKQCGHDTPYSFKVCMGCGGCRPKATAPCNIAEFDALLQAWTHAHCRCPDMTVLIEQARARVHACRRRHITTHFARASVPPPAQPTEALHTAIPSLGPQLTSPPLYVVPPLRPPRDSLRTLQSLSLIHI